MALNAKEIKLTTNEQDQPTKLEVKLDHRNALLFVLFMQIAPGLKAKGEQDGNPELVKQSEELYQAANYLEKYMRKLDIKKVKGRNITMSFTLEATPDEYDSVSAKVQQIMRNVYVHMAIEVMMGIEGQVRPASKEHKQSRSLARTVAFSTGKDTQQRTLFDLPLEGLKAELERQIAESPNGVLTKDVMSKKTAMLAQALIAKYDKLPKDEEGYVQITDVTQLAEDIFTDNKKLKYLLLYLGGYQYTHVAHFEDAIGFKIAKMFDIWLMYDKNREAKIDAIKNTIDETVNIILNERIKYIRIKPTAEFIRDLNGKGLGFIRVTDGFLATCNELSLLAYKILNYSICHSFSHSIGEEKLLGHLDMKDQVKKQGRPRIQKQIAEAMEELTRKGHFKKYKVEEHVEGLKYSWTYSDTIVKHHKQLAEGKDQEYIDYKDTSVPIEKRRERYQQYLVDEKDMTTAKARAKAEKVIAE